MSRLDEKKKELEAVHKTIQTLSQQVQVLNQQLNDLIMQRLKLEGWVEALSEDKEH